MGIHACDVEALGPRGQFWARVEKPETCWLWRGALYRDGYGNFRGARAHRVALRAHLGRPIRGFALHACDTRACVNPAHLREGSQTDNHFDALIRGRARSGERSHFARLTCAQVRAIQNRRSFGEPLRAIAQAFHVSEATVSRIHHGLTWRFM